MSYLGVALLCLSIFHCSAQTADSTQLKIQALFEKAKKESSSNKHCPSNYSSQASEPKSNTTSLEGRTIVSHPKIQDASMKEGIVVVDITVDQSGNVVKAVPGARGSTTIDSHLEKLATEAAYDTKFNADPNAPTQQQGSISFVFKLE